MAEADLHLKLDRILAQGEQVLARQDDFDAAVGALLAALHAMSDDMATQREVLAKLVERVDAASGDDGGEMRELIARLELHLGQIAGQCERMVTGIDALPRVLSDAAIDGVRLAMGDGLDLPKP